MMKILMVTRETQADKRYGLGKSLIPLMTALRQRGATVDYLCQADVGVRSLALLRILHKWLVRLCGFWFKASDFNQLTWGILERLNMGRLAAKVMAREGYTHVHCHDPLIAAGYRWFARLRWFMRLRTGSTARWGVTEHGFGCYAQAFQDEGICLSTGIMRWLQRWETKILLKAHWVITPTHSGLKQLARDLAIHTIPPTWHTIYHPCPILNSYPKAEARQYLGLSAHEIVIITVGRLVALKQFPMLLRTCAQLQHPYWRLIVLGEGDTTVLRQSAQELNITERVTFAVSDDIGRYYSAADIYVSISTTEAFGLANLEALTVGLPSICSAVGGVPEVVGNGAWLIPAQDNTILINALKTLVQDAHARDEWRQRAWAHCWYDISTIVEGYIAVYEGKPMPNLSKKPQNYYFSLTDYLQTIQSWHHCPLPRSLPLLQKAKILVIAPHPDDETLGCGGTIALLCQRGCQVKVVIMTDGAQGDPLHYVQDVVTHRQHETRAATQVLGTEDVVFFGEPDSRYQHTESVSHRLNAILDDFNPEWVFLPSVFDYHHDHVAVSLSFSTVWQQRGCRERLFLYETWGTVPATWVVNITSVFPLKQQAINCYALPLKYGDYLTGAAGMGSYRGLLFPGGRNQLGEAFLELQVDSWQILLSHLFSIRTYQEQCLSS